MLNHSIKNLFGSLKIRFEDVRVNDECLMIPVDSLTTIEQLQTQVYQKYKVPIYNQRFTFVKTDEKDSAAGDIRSPDEHNFETYLELLNYENTELVTNLDDFECSICLTIQYAGDGVVLKACLHTFCRWVSEAACFLEWRVLNRTESVIMLVFFSHS